ncbi:LacI family DNA-binding transcriptional regulator [Microbispora sp. ATCC PTA-5024]|uniref:LacI family DNA-binding transcriptional regulator n=1 Tax=Microbispora sp. ATCC PTA-5024 TaxID=316330 RepID=UPI0003DDA488|nr:LacI family DNA-binding transcriptional regulator [Microbispora sp. ATCC PTA-5024]ETK37287.1 LacI family transcriptional regulator [Microbispora sp. ATCC PTA-5024]
MSASPTGTRGDGRGRRPTLDAVATRAGVSRATASRVVNGDGSVTPGLREAVLRAVGELGYVPNAAARRLVTRRTDAVGLVFSAPPEGLITDDPMLSTVLRAASHELDQAGRQVVLLLAHAPRSRLRVEAYVAAGRVDAVITVPIRASDPLPGRLQALGVPVVSLGRPAARPGLPYVDNDNAGGAAMAVRHLLERGRRRIGTICGPLDLPVAQDRLAGYRDTLREAGRRTMVALGDFTRDSGAAAMRQLLEDDPGLDAVFAASDLMAVGALQALRQAGRRVPEDVAVVGFDDIEAAQYADPPLTTVRNPMGEQAAAGVRLLLRLLENGPADPVVLPAELVVRRSA